MNYISISHVIQDALNALGISPGTPEAYAAHISMLAGFGIGVAVHLLNKKYDGDLFAFSFWESFWDYCKVAFGLTFSGVGLPFLILLLWSILCAAALEPDYGPPHYFPEPPVLSLFGFSYGAIFWLLFIPLGTFTSYLMWKVTIFVKRLFNILARNWVPKSRS